jgi:hypothetical protein
MNDQTDDIRTDEELLTYEVSDEEIETVAGDPAAYSFTQTITTGTCYCVC